MTRAGYPNTAYEQAYNCFYDYRSWDYKKDNGYDVVTFKATWNPAVSPRKIEIIFNSPKGEKNYTVSKMLVDDKELEGKTLAEELDLPFKEYNNPTRIDAGGKYKGLETSLFIGIDTGVFEDELNITSPTGSSKVPCGTIKFDYESESFNLYRYNSGDGFADTSYYEVFMYYDHGKATYVGIKNTNEGVIADVFFNNRVNTFEMYEHARS